ACLGEKPGEDATEADEADAVSPLEVPPRERRRGPDRERERSLATRASGLHERVEEEDHVRVPLRVTVVDPQLAAASARAPVHAPQSVAGYELAQVRELDPVAARAGDLVSCEDLRLERVEEPPQLRRPRVDAERRGRRRPGLVHEEPGRVAGAHHGLADHVAAPAGAPDPQLDVPRLAGRDAQADRILPAR